MKSIKSNISFITSLLLLTASTFFFSSFLNQPNTAEADGYKYSEITYQTNLNQNRQATITGHIENIIEKDSNNYTARNIIFSTGVDQFELSDSGVFKINFNKEIQSETINFDNCVELLCDKVVLIIEQ